jgi:hypothetical protein
VRGGGRSKRAQKNIERDDPISLTSAFASLRRRINEAAEQVLSQIFPIAVVQHKIAGDGP